MKIRDYIKFINEDRIGFDDIDGFREEQEEFLNGNNDDINNREDDYAYLNDELDKLNRETDNRQKTYKTYDDWAEEDEEDVDEEELRYFRRHHKEEEEEEEFYGNEDEDSETMSDLIGLLLQMFPKSVDVNIEGTPEEITMYFPMRYYGSTLTDIIKIFEVLNKLSKDVLPEFDDYVDMYFRKGKNNIVITFSNRDYYRNSGNINYDNSGRNFNAF